MPPKLRRTRHQEMSLDHLMSLYILPGYQPSIQVVRLQHISTEDEGSSYNELKGYSFFFNTIIA